MDPNEMIKHIDLLMPERSRYEVLHYFTLGLAAGLVNCGIKCRLIEAQKNNPKSFLDQIFADPPDCTLSFNGILPDDQGNFLCEMIRTPHVSCLVDSPHYFLLLIRSPYNIITCVDRFSCDFFNSLNFHNVAFMPHAVNRELIGTAALDDKNRPYDVVMLASFTDYLKIQSQWEQKYGTAFTKALMDAAEAVLADSITSYSQALASCLDKYSREVGGFDPSKVDFIEILSDLENYIRGKDRFELVKSIKDTKVHIFGHESDKWLSLLGNPANVIAHDSVSYTESILIMQQSKIVLNSSPFFKNGAHERIFTGIACGALVITNENIYMKENFKNEEDILFYQTFNRDAINRDINHYLQNDKQRFDIVSRGQETVRNHHTWDQRAAALIKDINPILERIRSINV